MKTICLYFHIHQPFRLRRYRFFDIGNEHYYYDDYLNQSVIRRVADMCYLPANRLLLQLIRKYRGRFKLAFSISGMALEQFRMYTPEVIDSFNSLAATGKVEFLAETYAHSLAALMDRDEFYSQIDRHRAEIRDCFGQIPVVFRNTELIYSDEIGNMVAEKGFRGMITEGAKHILGWKSPNYVYCNAINPRLKVLLRNFKLSDDIAFRFSNKGWEEWPLTAGKFTSWIKALDGKEDLVNLFIDYETFGEHHQAETGIFDFLKSLPAEALKNKQLEFATPAQVAETMKPVAAIHVPHPISWADEEKDLTAWLGNDLQEEAFNKLYALRRKVYDNPDPRIRKDWYYLQNSDHFYYMCTKLFSDGAVHSYFNPFNSPYDAFINYMNILSDFGMRVSGIPEKEASEFDLARTNLALLEKEMKIQRYEEELRKLRSGIARGQAPGTEKKKKGGKKRTTTRLERKKGQ